MREPRALRVIFSMALREAAGFLRRAGWRGDLDLVARLSGDLDALLPRIGLACDLDASGAAPEDRLRAVSRTWLAADARRAGWHALLDYLGERHLATPGESAGVPALAQPRTALR